MNEDVRRDAYGGAILRFAPNPASLAMVTRVREVLRDALEDDDVRHAPLRMAPEDLFRRIGKVRRALYTDPEHLRATAALLEAAGLDRRQIAFDPVRLRVILHEGHANPAAQAVYLPHRDTWYAHPQGILTWWIPLDDVVPEETFEVYPDWFDRPVPNDSERFDYDAWVAKGWDLKIGWQDPAAGRTAVYPGALEDVPRGRVVPIAAARGENVVFAGAHFHETRKQAMGRTRYSLDFRVVHLGDHAKGVGAPNVDNRSRGSCLRDYTRGAHL